MLPLGCHNFGLDNTMDGKKIYLGKSNVRNVNTNVYVYDYLDEYLGKP